MDGYVDILKASIEDRKTYKPKGEGMGIKEEIDLESCQKYRASYDADDVEALLEGKNSLLRRARQLLKMAGAAHGDNERLLGEWQRQTAIFLGETEWLT